VIGRCFKWLTYALLGLLLLLLVILLPVVLVLGSESGSRWVIQHALGMQKALTLEVGKGNLLDGMEARNVHFRGLKFDLYIHHLLVRWSLASVLGARLQVDDLELEQTRLVLHGPASSTRTRLPTLPLPFSLVLVHGEMREAGIEQHGRYTGLTRLSLNRATWLGTTITLPDASAGASGGQLALRGSIQLRGDYPLDAIASLRLAEFDRQGLGPLRLKLAGDLGHLLLDIDSTGKLVARLNGSLDTLTPDLPWQAKGDWRAFASPWLPGQALVTSGGRLQASGTLNQLSTRGSAGLSGAAIPKGDYDWQVDTDWHSAHIKSFGFKGLGGSANAQGTVDWRQGVVWQLEAALKQIDLGKKWPMPVAVVPALTGTLKSKGQTTSASSDIGLQLELAGGERWQATLNSWGRPWDLQARQQLKLDWANVRRVVPGAGALASSDGSLSFTGTRADYRLGSTFHLVSDKTPMGLWHLEAAGHERDVQISRLDYDGDAGALSFTGRLALGRQLGWEGVLLLNNLQTGWLLPDWSGQFTGSLAGHGDWGKASRHVDLEQAHVTGILRDKPLSLNGAATLDLPLQAGDLPRFNFKDLQLTWGDDQLYADGGMTNAWSMRLDAKLHDLALIDARLAGQADVQLNLSGEPLRPSGLVHVQGQGIKFATVAIGTLKFDGDIRQLGLEPGSAQALATGITIGGSVVDSVQLSATGSRDSHELQWAAKAAHIALEGHVRGHFDEQTHAWSGSEQQGAVHIPDMDWVLDTPATLAFSLEDHTLRVGVHCWSSAGARLCNEDELLAGAAGHAKVRLTGLDAARLQHWLPAGMSLEGTIAGNGDANWQAGELPEASLNLLTQGGAVVLAREGEDQPPLRLGYNLIALQAFIQPDSWRLRFDLLSENMGNGYVDARVDPHDPNHPLTGETALQGLQLDVFRPFFPALTNLSGLVAASGQIGGVLKRPAFDGQVSLSGGQLVTRDAPVNLHDIGLVADIHGDAMQLKGQASSGDGQARLNGEAGWGDNPHLNLSLQGQDFEVRQMPMLDARLDPDLRLAVVPGQVNITGQVRVPYANIVIKDLSEKATPLSPDVEVVNADDKAARAQIAAAMKSWQVNADIEVLLGDKVSFRGFGVIGLLSGDIRLQQQGKRGLQGTGDVELDKNARYEAYGQKLQITRGRIIFAGPLTQPGIDVEASKLVDTKTVGIRVTGRANAPEVTFFSDADISQGDIVSYLLVGRPLYQSGQLNTLGSKAGSTTTAPGTATAAPTSQDLALATAAIKLGSTGGGEDIANRLGGLLGVQDVAVGAEQTSDDTQFTVSGYISPRLYLSYGVGVFTPVNTVKLRYNITARLYLQAASSLENAIDLYYNFRF
jgi:translocation and assembly module TamB